MNKNRTTGLLEEKIPRRIYGLLLCDDMTISELAEAIYKDKNQRAMITKWINELLKTKMIKRTDMGFISHRGKVYRADLFPLGDFNKEEKQFVEIVLNRFINRDVRDIVGSFTQMFDKILMIQKIFKSKGQIERYGFESKDYKDYENNKEKFWSDSDYRDKTLKAIKTRKAIKTIIRDFVFMSLIAPESLQNSLFHSGLNNIDDPLYVSSLLI